MDFFGFIVFGSASWICRFVFCQIWGAFSHYFFDYFFQLYFYLLSETTVIQILLFCDRPTGPWGSVHFFPNLLPLCSSDWVNLYFSTYYIIDSSLPSFCCQAIHWILYLDDFALVFFSSKILIWFLIICSTFVCVETVSLLRFYIFSFVSGDFLNCLWKHFLMSSLKFLSNYSKISVILMLESIHCLFHLVWDLPDSWYGEWLSIGTLTFWVLCHQTLVLTWMF